MSGQPAIPIQEHSPAFAQIGHAARAASRLLAHISESQINTALNDIANSLRAQTSALLALNKLDIDQAHAKGLTAAAIDRLSLSEARIEAMAKGLEIIAALPDPVGRTLSRATRPNGLVIEKISVPLGVIGMIYEARPNVTIDAAGLCLKSRNAVILRSGSECLGTTIALCEIFKSVLNHHGFPQGCVEIIPTRDRELVGEMLRGHEFIDVLIPRGGKGLIERVQNEAAMPVFSHLDGICHVYVHPSVNPDLAVQVVLNAKMRRTGICGAAETLLLDKALAPEISANILKALNDAGCELITSPQSWSTEYLDAKLSVGYVDGIEAAVDHINTYGSHHTESILCEDQSAAAYFLNRVESAIVMHNTSTQFADGGEFGMGAEIGISTGRFHARGPIGLEELTIYKYIVRGHGQTRP